MEAEHGQEGTEGKKKPARSMVERTDNHHRTRKHRLAEINRIRGCSCSREHLDVDLLDFCQRPRLPPMVSSTVAEHPGFVSSRAAPRPPRYVREWFGRFLRPTEDNSKRNILHLFAQQTENFRHSQ